MGGRRSGIGTLAALLAFALSGFCGGYMWAWWNTRATMRIVLASHLETIIDENDREERLARARELGYVRGLRSGTCVMYGIIGLAAGIVVWAIWRFI
jgi:hypothetical protein